MLRKVFCHYCGNPAMQVKVEDENSPLPPVRCSKCNSKLTKGQQVDTRFSLAKRKETKLEKKYVLV